MGKWQPVETAPRDGTRILAYGLLGLENEKGVGTVKWIEHRKLWWCDPNEASEYDPWECKITHWQPLPEPPQ